MRLLPLSRHRSTAAPLPLLLLLLLLLPCLVLLLAAPAAALAACNCNNGLVRPTATNFSVYYLDAANSTGSGGRTPGVAPSCACVCFDGYLLPRCLYNTSDLATVELWLAGPAQTGVDVADLNNVMDRTILAASDLASMVSNSFGLVASENNFAVQYMLWINASFVWPAAAAALGLAADANVSAARVMLQLPGWAAQYVVNDGAQGRLAAYTVASVDGTQTFVGVAVRDYQPGPTTAPTFPQTWMRVYPSGGDWYMSFEQAGWFLGALLLTLFFFILEAKCMFNMDYNVGGGAVKYHHVRQEIAADEDAYYRQQKVSRKAQRHSSPQPAGAAAAAAPANKPKTR